MRPAGIVRTFLVIMGKSKQRKLDFIRQKNAIRLGETLWHSVKISDLLIKESDINEFINSGAKYINNRLSKKWKLKFNLINAKVGKQDDDYIRDLSTVLLIFKAD